MTRRGVLIVGAAVFAGLVAGAVLGVQQKRMEPRPSVVREDDLTQPDGRMFEIIREQSETLPFFNIEADFKGMSVLFNKNPIVLPNRPQGTNLMAQYDGLRFRAPAQTDISIMFVYPKRMKHVSWNIFPVQRLALMPALGYYQKHELQAGTRIGDYVVPEEGATCIFQRFPMECFYEGEMYVMSLSMPCDGNNLNKDEYPGYIAIRGASLVDQLNAAYTQLHNANRPAPTETP